MRLVFRHRHIAHARKQTTLAFRVSMRLFIFLDLLLEFGLNNINSRKHVECALTYLDSVVWQMQDDIAGALLFAVGFAFFQSDFQVGAFASLLRQVLVHAAKFSGNIFAQIVADFGMYSANFKFL